MLSSKKAFIHIGSLAWILSEKTDSRTKETACLEDFALSARNDFEWLNEYMFETFSRNDFIDVIELLKTPGRLRGKTPRRIQKSKDKYENSRRRLTSTPRQGVNLPSVQNSSSPFEENPTVPPPDTVTKDQDKSDDSNFNNNACQGLQDSGIWASSDSQVCETAISPLSDLASRGCGGHVNKNTSDMRSSESCLMDAVVALGIDQTKAPEADMVFAEETTYGTPKKTALVSPVEGHIDADQSESVNWSPICQSDSEISSYTPPTQDILSYNLNRVENQEIQTEFSSRPTQIQTNATFTPGPAKKTCEESASRSDDISESEINSPQISVQTSAIVRNSLNFASLPAREPSNNRKSINGARISRSSHLITVPARSDKSLGGEVSESLVLVGQEDKMENVGNNDMSPETVKNEEVPSIHTHTLEASLPLLKSKSQRLNERISQLSQLAPIRPSRSVPDLEVSSSAINENLSEPSNITTAEDQPTHNSELEEHSHVEDEDEDWIPQRPQVLESKAEVSEIFQQTDNASFMPSIGVPSIANNAVTIEDVKASDAYQTNTSPSRLPKAVKSYTDSDTESFLQRGTPKRTGKTNHDKLVASYKSPFDSALNAVKNHQANLFTKAKQMLFSKAKNDAPIEQVSNALISSQISPSKLADISTSRKPLQCNGRFDTIGQHKTTEAQQTVPENPYLANSSPRKKLVLTGNQILTAHQAQADHFFNDANIHFVPINEKTSNTTCKSSSALTKSDPASIAGEDIDAGGAQNHMSEAQPDDRTMPRNMETSKVPSHVPHHHPVEDNSELNIQENILKATHDILEDDFDSSDSDSDRQQPSKLPKPTPNSSVRFQESVPRASILQKSTNNKNIIRSNSAKAQDMSRNSKNMSGSIKLTTASQREMDQRKIPISSIFTNDTFSQKETHITKISNPNTGPPIKVPRSIAALTTAARAQKKEQEERERKRLEIERRRHENLKREEERKQHQQARQKKNLQSALDEEQKKKGRPIDVSKNLNSITKPLVRVNTVTNLKKAIEQASNQDTQNQADLKRQPKRLFQTELVEHGQPQSQVKNVFVDSFPEAKSKRRKTVELQDEFEEQSSPVSLLVYPTTQLPKTKLEPVKTCLFSQLSTPGPKLAQQVLKSKLSYSNRTTIQTQTLEKTNVTNSQMPPVDVVKFSHDTIKFAATTPAAAQNLFTMQSQPSPIYPSGDNIELPDIQTDSEDDDDQADYKIPVWAESPELRLALKNQLIMDPEAVFGPMAPLSMEDIFKGRGDRVNARFRNRTSSANWGGQDRLTSAEIEADKVERQRMIENNGWTYE